MHTDHFTNIIHKMNDTPKGQEPNQQDLSTLPQRLHPHAVEGLELFNQKKYFEAHEELEIAWKEEKGAIRELYRGILQVGVAYLHIQRGNLAGAVKMFQRCHRFLDPFPDTCLGINLGKFRHDFKQVETFLKQKGLIPAAQQEYFFKSIEYRIPDE